MADPDQELTEADYPWLTTMDDVINICIRHLEKALECQTEQGLGVELSMASKAMRCAMDVYGMRLAVRMKGKPSE